MLPIGPGHDDALGLADRNVQVGPGLLGVVGLLEYPLFSSNAGCLPQYQFSLAETVMF